jgi:hypothetical protein
MPPHASVVIFGSTEPWYESIALAFGARSVVVVEYNNLTYGTIIPHSFSFDSTLPIMCDQTK